MAFLRKFNMDLRSAARCGIHWTPGKEERITLDSPLDNGEQAHKTDSYKTHIYYSNTNRHVK